MMRINGMMNNCPISYKAKMDKGNDTLSKKTSDDNLKNKASAKDILNAMMLASTASMGLLSFAEKQKKAKELVRNNEPKNFDVPKQPINDSKNPVEVKPVVDLGAPIDEMNSVIELPEQPVFVDEINESKASDDISNSADIELDETSELDIEEEISFDEREEMIENLKKEIDCLSAEEAYGINKYYKDCDCSVINTDVHANEKGFFIEVRLIDEKIRKDEDLKEEIIQELKLRQFIEMNARLGLHKEPTPELLALETVNLKELNKELLDRATIYMREIEMPNKIEEKIFEPWYINYIKLCKQLGISARECGVPGGAFDHYLQLQQRQNTETYPEYVKLLEYRAGYDENAFHNFVNLSVDDDKLAPKMGDLLHNLASSYKDELYSLKRVIKLVEKEPKTNYKLIDMLQALKDKKITFDKFLLKLRLLQDEVSEEMPVQEEILCEDTEEDYEQQTNYYYQEDNFVYV